MSLNKSRFSFSKFFLERQKSQTDWLLAFWNKIQTQKGSNWRTLIILSTEQAVKTKPKQVFSFSFLTVYLLFMCHFVAWWRGFPRLKQWKPAAKRQKSHQQFYSVVPELWPYLSKNWTWNSSQTSDRCLPQELNLLCCSVDNFPLCNNFSTVSDASVWLVNPRQLHDLARAVRAPLNWTRDAFSQV